MTFSRRQMNAFKLIALAFIPILLYYVLSDMVSIAVIYASTFSAKEALGTDFTHYISNKGVAGFSEDLIEIVQRHSMEVLILSQAVIIPIMFAMFKCDFITRRREGRLYKCYYNNKFPKYLFLIPFGIATMYCGNLITSFLTFFMPQSFLDKYSEVESVLYGSSIPIQIIATVIGAPIVEELIVRGLIFNRVKDYIGVVWAAIVSSLVFGAMHGNLVQGTYATIVGLALAYVYEKYSSLWAPILMHCVCNTCSILLTFLAQSIKIDSGEIPTEMTLDLAYQFATAIAVVGVIAAIFGALIFAFVKPTHYEQISPIDNDKEVQ